MAINAKKLFGDAIHSPLSPLLLILGFVFGGAHFLRAQVSTGAINGTVRDSSGAVVPNATVTLANVATGVKRTTETNSVGNYGFVDIHPGSYDLAVSKAGFKTARESEILVLVNQTSTYNFTVQVGTATQAITVTAPAAKVETSTAELGSVVTTRPVNDLPLNGRNFTELLSLTPGVSPVNTSQSNGFMANPIGDFTFPAINGQTNRSNFYFLDGLNDQNDYASAYAVAPVVDDIEEFKVQSHNDQAEFGGVLGGIINVVTKSGTNQFHGSAWEFVRNNTFDARDPFVANVTPYKQNQFGGTIGGPVILPHYNGRNKTFFFGTYEGFRARRASESLYTVPTPAELNGDLSAITAPIYNPFTTRPDPNNPGKLFRDPFANNQIPASLIDPHMVAYAKALFPGPVQTGVPGINGIDNFSNLTDQDEMSVRLDEALNATNSFWFRYSAFWQPVLLAGGYVGNYESQHTIGNNWGASWIHTFGPSATLQAEFGHNSVGLTQVTGWPVASTNSLIQQAGFASEFACSFQFGPRCQIPGISINGFLGAGPLYFNYPASDVWETKADFTKIVGRNTFETGFDINKNGLISPYGKGGIDSYENETMTSFETSNLETSSGGSALGSFLLGVPDSASLRGTYSTEYGGWIDGFYFQDQIKATRHLTVNLGGRYEFTLRPLQGSRKDGNLYIGDLDLNNGTYILQAQPPSCAQTGKAPCIPGGVLPSDVVVTPFSNNSIVHNDYDNIAPRAGLAYSLNPKTVIRASAGRFFDNWAALDQTAQNYTGTWPEIIQFLGSNLNPGAPTVSAESPLAAQETSALPGPTPFNQTQWYMSPVLQNPYSWQWNFGIERQLTPNTLLSANYVGSSSSRLDLGPYENVATTPGPGTPAQVAARRPFPYIQSTYYDNSIGRSHYSAFQFELKKTYTHGLTYLVSYTWSKCMDLAGDDWYGVGASVENPYNLDGNMGVCGFDLTNNLTGSWVYQLPFGAGGRFVTGNRVVDNIIGHWQFNGISTFTSGQPYDIGVSGDIANTGNTSGAPYGYERLNVVGNPTLANPTTSQWFNEAAFAVPAPYTFGDLGRNALRADGFVDFDLSLFRSFPITEDKRLEFRFEAFNSTNTPTWGIPGQVYSTPTFGEVTSTRSVERELQFALKFYF
jgi:hypothetical protein